MLYLKKKGSFLFVYLLTFCALGHAQISHDINLVGNSVISNYINDIDSIRFLNSAMEVVLEVGTVNSVQISEIDNVTFSEVPEFIVTNLECSGAIISGQTVEGTAATNVQISLSYSGGNGGYYPNQSITSTGVIGLIANRDGGLTANGDGTLIFTVSGTPTSSGLAIFHFQVGENECEVQILVEPIPTCSSSVTFSYNGEVVTYGIVEGVDSRCWLDRNLGAVQVATDISDEDSFGDLFQWGRDADGHQLRNSTQTSALSSSNIPGHSNFITVNSSPFDWRSPQNGFLWQGVSGVNNPCPDGYRIPTEEEWEAERQNWPSNGSIGAYSSTLKLSCTGNRSHEQGTFSGTGYIGFYWSSTQDNIQSRVLQFDSGTGATMANGVRAKGFAVRCIQD